MGFGTPLFLWGGLAAVAVPVLIHLLMKQKPVVVQWAAMVWLQAAMQVTQKRYKLTHLLLLLLRCLVLLLIALAMARPHVSGLGNGGDVVFIVDGTASMGSVSGDNGAMAELKRQLEEHELGWKRVCVALWTGADLLVVVDGTGEDVQHALSHIQAGLLPGGLDTISTAGDDIFTQLSSVVHQQSLVVFASDFRQDSGQQLEKALTPLCEKVIRWQLGESRENGVITQIHKQPDIMSETRSALELHTRDLDRVVTMRIDDGSPVPVTSSQDATLRLDIPPLTVGEHLVSLEWDDDGLQTDNSLSIPVYARDAIDGLIVHTTASHRLAALRAAHNHVQVRSCLPASFGNEMLPKQGFIVLTARIHDGKRLREWVENGGLLWSDSNTLASIPELANVLPDFTEQAGGSLRTEFSELNSACARIHIETALHAASGTALLYAGASQIVSKLPVGSGNIILEHRKIEELDDFWLSGIAPLWIRETIRTTINEKYQPLVHMSGSPLTTELNITREGQSLYFSEGERLLAQPGIWESEHHTHIILPDIHEQTLSHFREQAPSQLEEVVPDTPGASWSLIAGLLGLFVLLGEAAFAAAAGKRYGC